MTVLGFLVNHIGRLVHPDARGIPLVRARHGVFIAARLGLFAAALASLPVVLALGRPPAPGNAAALAWLAVPVAAAAFLSRTGRLGRAEAASMLGWTGFAATALLGGGLGASGALAILFVVALEAGQASSRRAVLLAAMPAAGLAALLAAGFAPPGPGAHDGAILAAAFIYAGVIAAGQMRVQALQRRSIDFGTQNVRALSEVIDGQVVRCDRSGTVTAASPDDVRTFGLRARDLVGRGLFDRVHVVDRPAFLQLLSEASLRPAPVVGTIRLRVSGAGGPDGALAQPSFAHVELRARRLAAASREAGTPLLAVLRDMTAQKQHEQQTQEARDRAERAHAWKDAFLANISHELRTPLNAIIGFSEILADPALIPADPAKQHEYAGIIATSGQHLLSVVNSLLDISKIEAGRFELAPEAFDVAATIQSCCDMIGLKAEQAGIAVQQERSAALGEIVADRRACKQIVINLLSNALKFTPRGGRITVGSRRDGSSVVISVADTGIGIEAADLARLGDAFFQARSGYDRPYEGTGLGLSVVRGLVGLHGGSMAVDSLPGDGTRVLVRLPLDCRGPAHAGGAVKIDVIGRASRRPARTPVPEPTKVQKIA